jgi:oxygen-independent coproporphyrinogen-3 oxidase
MIDFINNEKAPRKLGLYIHIPFCKTKCLYCDFCSFVSREEDEREQYVDALIGEIEARGTREYLVDTVYFGGGTPSLLSVEQIGRILSAVRENFAVCDDVEVSLECNPMTHLFDGREYFTDLRKLGINRLSIGIQSAIDGELKLIGRRHSFDEAKRTFSLARESGFENISVDLMFGIPSQTKESLMISLEEFVSLGAEHISIYSLQLEEGTPLYRMQERYSFADDDTVAQMYETVVSFMKEAGYCHYEISNFAKCGRESRHNSKYWRLDEYLGLGLAAHSDFSGKRIENTKDLQKYLLGEYIENEMEISCREREFEFLMLGLRTSGGISKSEFFARFGVNFDEKYGQKVKNLEKMGYFWQNDEVAALSESGFEVSNSILAQILDFDY